MSKERMIFTDRDSQGFKHGIVLLVALIATLGVLGGLEMEDKKVEDARYCYQVALNKADPTQGWPDFDERYDSMCSGAGLKPGLE